MWLQRGKKIPAYGYFAPWRGCVFWLLQIACCSSVVAISSLTQSVCLGYCKVFSCSLSAMCQKIGEATCSDKLLFSNALNLKQHQARELNPCPKGHMLLVIAIQGPSIARKEEKMYPNSKCQSSLRMQNPTNCC